MIWIQVVDEQSACIDGYEKVPLPTDHIKINKYAGPEDPSYMLVFPKLVAIASTAVEAVQKRLKRLYSTILALKED